MSGQAMPVPDVLAAGPDAFSYILPTDDFSMLAPSGERSIPPGTALILDPARRIDPGDRILVALKDFELPMLRIYKATRPYAPGTPFTLVALNAAFDAIRVDDAGQVLTIARLIWTGQQW